MIALAVVLALLAVTACGQAGGGTSLGPGWSAAPLGHSELTGASFIDAQRGWACSRGIPVDQAGEDGVWATTDGGASWRLLAKEKLSSLCFVNGSGGWAVGVPGIHDGLFRTADGGTTWERVLLKDEPESLHQVRFVDERHGFIAAGQYGAAHGGWVYTTTDGGRTWEPYRLCEVPLKTVFFIDAKEGWAAGDEDVFHTLDGGLTWTQQLHRGNGELAAGDIWFSDSQHGWIASEIDGSLWRTQDGGVTWMQCWHDWSTGVYSVRFRSADVGWAAGIRYPDESRAQEGEITESAKALMLRTADGGLTWREEDVPGRFHCLFALELLDDGGLIATGDGGVLRFSPPPPP